MRYYNPSNSYLKVIKTKMYGINHIIASTNRQTAITCIELEPSLIELLVLLHEEEIEEFLGFPLSQIFNDLSSSLLASIIDKGFSVQV